MHRGGGGERYSRMTHQTGHQPNIEGVDNSLKVFIFPRIKDLHISQHLKSTFKCDCMFACVSSETISAENSHIESGKYFFWGGLCVSCKMCSSKLWYNRK